MLQKATQKIILALLCLFSAPSIAEDARQRLIISTDLQGGDEDDYQSLIHFLYYIDSFDTKGIVISPPRRVDSRVKFVLAAYKRDFPNLRTYSELYPTPGELKRLFIQGATVPGVSQYTEGSKKIVKEALAEDSRVLNVLVWGAITDLALAIKQEPKIKRKIKVYFINAGWNRDQDIESYRYVMQQTNLNMIDAVSTSRGIYLTGLFDTTKYGNVGFVKKVLRKHGGYLGKYFYKVSKDINVNSYGIKMGDTPSFLRLLKKEWGGKFCKSSYLFLTDCKNPEYKIGSYFGARTVSRHRLAFLKDFESRLKRASVPNIIQ